MKKHNSIMQFFCWHCDMPNEVVVRTKPFTPEEVPVDRHPPFVSSYVSECEGDVLRGRNGEMVSPVDGKLMLYATPDPPPWRHVQPPVPPAPLLPPLPPPLPPLFFHRKRRGRPPNK